MSEAYGSLELESRAAWRAWLTEHHADTRGVWAVTYKKAAGERHVPYDELVEEALCFGWVDSMSRRVDDERSRLLMTPRKPRSGWARTNKARVQRLIEAGLMTPAGLAAIEMAKADGSWTLLDDVENLVEPADLRAALDARPAARSNWDDFPPSARRGILGWILNAKRPETRAKRVHETAEQAARGIRANQWVPPDRR